EQRLEADLVVLDLEEIKLEALLLGEASLGGHQEKARVRFRRDDAVAPGLELLRMGRCRGAGRKQRSDRGAAGEPHEVGRCHRDLLAYRESFVVRPFIKTAVKNPIARSPVLRVFAAP